MGRIGIVALSLLSLWGAGPPFLLGIVGGGDFLLAGRAAEGAERLEASPPSENGREPRSASAIPLPPSLPQPRIDISVAPDGGSPLPHEWSLKEFAGSAKVRVEKIGPHFAVRLSSDKASFSLHKDVTVDVTQFPYLSWAWRVDRLPPAGDARQKETDDQAAQVYVIFPRFPALVRSQIIGYIWDSTAPAGTVLTSPSNPLAKIVVLRSGSDRLGQWTAETRNVLEDYKRLFGGAPPKVGRISLLINSQHTKSTAESSFAGLVFTQIPLQGEMGLSADAMPVRAERNPGPGRFEHTN